MVKNNSNKVTSDILLPSGEKEQSFLSQHGQKLTALMFWLIAIGGYFWYATTNNLGPIEVVNQLISVLSTSSIGPLLFILVYALRPLIFFSAAVLTIASGLLFGPVWGLVYAVIGGNISAMVAYYIGRYFGQGVLDSGDSSDGESVVQRYAQQMRKNPFESILTMRFIFLPYDLVNYLAGFLKIDWKPFLFATFLGSLPGGLSFVLIGASIEGNAINEIPSLNPVTLGVSVVIFLSSLAFSRYLKNREAKKEGQA